MPTNKKNSRRPRLIKTARSSARQDKTRAECEDAYRLLVEAAADYAVVILDPDGKVATWNAGSERLYGYRSNEIIGQHFSCFYSADDIQRGVPENTLKLAAQMRHEEQIWRMRKNGERFCASVTTSALRAPNGAVTSFCDITRDLSEIRFAEIARGIFESFPAAIVLIDGNGRITQMNAQIEPMFGYRPKELQGQTVESLVPERFRERHRQHVAAYTANPQIRPMGVTLELSGRRKNGSEFPVDIMLSPITAGHEGMVMAVIRDITEPKRAAEDIRKSNDELITLVTELQRRDREMQSLISMDDLLQSCTSQEDAYKVIGLAAGELFEAQTGCLAVLHASGQYLETVARWGSGPLGDPVFSLDDCWALRRGQLHEVSDAQTGLLCRHFVGQPKTRYLCVPLTVQGEILGVFCLTGACGNGGENQISHLQLAVTVSESIKLSLSNLKLREKLRAEAIHDPLTGLFNRRYLEETLVRELHRARRRNSPLCVAMLDLDNFKRFNDSHGHEAGDALLREVGGLMRAKLRKSDISCRYGGEEFVIVLPDSSLADAAQRVEQIRAQVKELQIHYGGGLLTPLTISAGVAQADEHQADPGELLRAADKALYSAKNSGRDRVISYGVNEK